MLRRPDSEMELLLKTFTFLPLGEIENTLTKHRSRPESRGAQEKLAENVTLLLHGEEGLILAQKSTDIIFNNDIKGLSTLSLAETRSIFKQADYVQKLYQPGISILGKLSMLLFLLDLQYYFEILAWMDINKIFLSEPSLKDISRTL